MASDKRTTRRPPPALFADRVRRAVEAALPAFLPTRRWFAGKARRISGARVTDVVPLEGGGSATALLVVQVDYSEGDPERYVIDLALAMGRKAAALQAEHPTAVVCEVGARGRKGLVYDATFDPSFGRALLDAIARGRRLRGEAGVLVASHTRSFRRAAGRLGDLPAPSRLAAEQSNTSLRFGDRMILKLFRKVEAGTNPDLEMTAFLTQRAGFSHVPPAAGCLEYRPATGARMTLGFLQGYVPNQGDAWHYTLESLAGYFDRVLARPPGGRGASVPEPGRPALREGALEDEAVGAYLEAANLLGLRTAELHLALASHPEDPDFAPEPFTPAYQRSIHESMCRLAAGVCGLLERRLPTLPEHARYEAEKVKGLRERMLAAFRVLTDGEITAMRTRYHGDYHLGQVLWTGGDFFIIDFEGEPARPLWARRLKRSPLRDVAGMMRSFHYAARHALAALPADAPPGPRGEGVLEDWADLWYHRVSSAFLGSYLHTAGDAAFLPRTQGELERLLRAYLLEKAVYELGYELNNRPAWVGLPLRGISETLEAA
jgi:trehalose synthase-fused probable maltokinase